MISTEMVLILVVSLIGLTFMYWRLLKFLKVPKEDEMKFTEEEQYYRSLPMQKVLWLLVQEVLIKKKDTPK